MTGKIYVGFPTERLKELTVPELRELWQKNRYEYNSLLYRVHAFGWDDSGTDQNAKDLSYQNWAINVILEHLGELPEQEKER